MLTNNQDKNPKKPLVTNFIRNLLPLGVRSQKGSTLPMAIGLGSAMMIVGAVAVMKGGQENTNTTASEQTKQALAVAEAGVTNIQSFLAENPSLAMLDSDDWGTIIEKPSEIKDTIKLEVKKSDGTTLAEEIAEKEKELKLKEEKSKGGESESFLCDANSNTTSPTNNDDNNKQLGEKYDEDKIQEGLKEVVGMKLVNSEAKPDWVSLGDNGEYRLVKYERVRPV